MERGFDLDKESFASVSTTSESKSWQEIESQSQSEAKFRSLAKSQPIVTNNLEKNFFRVFCSVGWMLCELAKLSSAAPLQHHSGVK